jgi:hypothetical protein
MKITRRRLAGITATAVAAGLMLATPAHAVPPTPADAPEHNARVAEYLMQAHTGLNEHNARVAEYLLMLPSR